MQRHRSAGLPRSGADERFTRQRRALLIPAFNWRMTFSTDVTPTCVSISRLRRLHRQQTILRTFPPPNCPMAARHRALAGSYRKDVTCRPFLFVVNRFVPSYCVEELQYCLTKSQVVQLRACGHLPHLEDLARFTKLVSNFVT
jgi:pimeloyl-ACP methyl ester carboxylesterase